MDTLTSLVLKHRRMVVLGWILLFFVGGWAAGQVSTRLVYDFSLPGQEGYETSVKILEDYGTASDYDTVVTFTAPEGSTAADQSSAITSLVDQLRAVEGVRVVGFEDGAALPGFTTDDDRTSFVLVFSPPPETFVDPTVAAIEEIADGAAGGPVAVGITGYGQLQGGGEADEGPSVLFETLIGALGALAVLLFVFASILALVPLIIAAVAICVTFFLVLLLTLFTDVSFVVQFLVALVGLGVAIDYSLLVVSRWREERAHGHDNEEAVRISMRTAGHAVFASGLTVAISLLALIVIPVPLLQSMGYGGMLIPLVSVAACLTLLPAMLSTIGPRADWPHIRKENRASVGWTKWAAAIVRRPWLAAAAAALILGLLIAPVTQLQIGQANSESLADSGPAHDTLVLLEEGGVGTGVLSPMVMLFDTGDQAEAAAAAVREIPDVHSATVAPPGSTGRVAVDVVPIDETVDSTSVEVVHEVRDAVKDLPGYQGIAGLGPTILDYDRAVFQNFPYVIAIIAFITFVLLVRTFRSLLLPLKAVLLNLVSLAAVFGFSTWFWQLGNGSEAIFGIAATGAMTFWIPPIIFAFLFGLSMDYEVFILARMREEYDATGSTPEAIIRGLGRTGRLVTSAALILFFAFAALASAPGTDIKVFATALGVGILIDATVVRALLVPALVRLFGRWNWWLPGWLATLMRVEPSPLPARDEPMSEEHEVTAAL